MASILADETMLSTSQDLTVALARQTESKETAMVVSQAASPVLESKGEVVAPGTAVVNAETTIANVKHSQNYYGPGATHKEENYFGSVTHVMIATPQSLPAEEREAVERAAMIGASTARASPKPSSNQKLKGTSKVKQTPSSSSSPAGTLVPGKGGAWVFVQESQPTTEAEPELEPLPPLFGEPWAAMARDLDRKLEGAFGTFARRGKERMKAAAEAEAAQAAVLRRN